MPGTAELAIFIRARDEATRTFDKLAGKAGGLSKAVGTAALAGGAALAGIGIAATKMAADFESSMAEVRTLMPDASDEAFGALREDLLDFSKEMGIATDQAVPALYQAISAGVPRENVMSFMEVASKAAVGGVTDLETAVDGITSVVNAYGSEVIDAQKAADIMFTGVKLGKTDFEQLSRSLFNVIPTAASLGVSFEEVTAALATMTAQGVPTSVATTQLRQALVEASKGGSKLDEAIREMAGKGFAELIGEGETATDIFDELRGSMPEQEFKDLFGSVEAMNAALQITGPNADAMRSALEEAGASAGAVDEAFSVVSETASFKFGKAMNQLRVMMIEFGSIILPIVSDFLTGVVVPALERLSGWFEEHRPQIEAAINAIAEAAAELASYFKAGMEVIMPLLEDFAKFLFDHKPLLIAAITAVGAAIAVALGPASAAVLAIAGIIMLVGFLSKNWDDIKAKTEEIWSAIGEFMDTKLGALKLLFQTMFNEIKTIITTVLDSIRLIFQFFQAIFQGDWDRAGQKLKELFTGIWDAIKEIVLGRLQLIAGILNYAWAGLRELTRIAWDAIRDRVGEAIGALKEKVEEKIRQVVDFFTDLKDRILRGLGNIKDFFWNLGRDMIQSLINGLKSIPLPDLTPGFDVPGVPFLQAGIPYVPRNMLAYLHQGEMVLPAPVAEKARGGGDTNFNITINAGAGADPYAIGEAVQDSLHRALRLRGAIV